MCKITQILQLAINVIYIDDHQRFSVTFSKIAGTNTLRGYINHYEILWVMCGKSLSVKLNFWKS